MNLKTVVAGVSAAVITFLLALWGDTLIFGGRWQDYLLMSVLETGCFFAGIIVGWIWGRRGT